MSYTLPSVDIRELNAPGKVYRALSNFGAFFLKGGKTSEFRNLEKLIKLSKFFFHDTSDDVKAGLHQGFDEGYLSSEGVSYEGQRDICEQLAVNPEQSKSRLQWSEAFLDNGFTEQLYSFISLCEKDCLSLYSILEAALSLPPGFFVNKHQNTSSKLFRLMRYPQSDEYGQGEIRKPAHTDFGTFTLLFLLDSIGGLQVKSPADGWIDVMPGQPAVLVIGGGILEQWTNSRCPAAVHRVVREAGEKNCRERLSATYFVDPDKDAVINSQDIFPGEASICSPATAAECLEKRLKSIKVREKGF